MTRARHWAREFAAKQQLSQPVVDRIALAVTEATANVVLHAYHGIGEGELWLEAGVNGDWVELTVRDQGRGVSAADRATAAGGFGLILIRQLADDVELREGQPGTILRMRFRQA